MVLPLGQAIGRWANFVNQELYGAVTTLPWGIQIDSAHRVAPYTSTIDFPYATTFFHPLFLYESLLSILAFILLLNLFQRYRSRFLPGDLFLVYIMQYTFIRFLLEFMRAEPAYLPGTTINSSQTISVIGFMIALVWFLYRHRAGGGSRGASLSAASRWKTEPAKYNAKTAKMPVIRCRVKAAICLYRSIPRLTKATLTSDRVKSPCDNETYTPKGWGQHGWAIRIE